MTTAIGEEGNYISLKEKRIQNKDRMAVLSKGREKNMSFA